MSAMSSKYGAINLSQGFPDFDSDPILIDLVRENMEKGNNQYAPMPGHLPLREQIARKVKMLYKTTVSPESEITITAGATQAIFTSLIATISAGDEVVLMEPAYDCYAPGVILAGGKPVAVPFKAPNFEWPWDTLEEAVSDQTKMIMITNPHNPLGKIMGESDIARLDAIVKDKNIILLVDEVYEHLVFDGQPHLSIVKYPALYQKSIITYSFGKTFHNTGWKLGYAIAPPALTHHIRMVHQFNVFSVNTPIQYALAEYMSRIDDYHQLGGFFQRKRDLFIEGLKETPLVPLPCQGSYFLLADYSRWRDDSDLKVAADLTQNYGVATIPLSPFYQSKYSGRVVRLCFAKKESTLEQALSRLQKLEL